ncbi:MAG: transporter substrate-binding domain-containing protein [Chloroflexi bacterium]|nr:transporter substrate-binding domain-containing protein [Chloroflexota bacterium]
MNRPTHRKFNFDRRPLLAALLILLAALGLLAATGWSRLAAAQDVTPTIDPALPAPTLTPTTAPTATPSPEPTITPTSAAPTLVPPTPIAQDATPLPVQQVSESGLAYAQENKVLRIGTYFNAYPFAWLNERGIIDGYEAEIMRAIGIELGVEPEFVQVTRRNAVPTLLSGEVDVLIGQQILARDRKTRLDFSHPYYLNEQRMVVQTDSPYTSLDQFAGLPVSVEIGSRSERALRNFSAASGIQFDIRTYFTESEALDALALGEVQGMVGELDSLRRAGRQQMRLIDTPVLFEPYAIVVRRWDVNLRNILNRSLQRLQASGRMEEIFANWFPGESMDFHGLIPVYDTLYEDERGLDQFNTDLPLPAHPVLERIEGGLPIRVAGVATTEEMPTQVRLMNAFNRALLEDMAQRWGAQIEFVPDSVQNPVDLVANGQADLAIGVTPRWDGADRVEYSLPYILHGNRIAVPTRSDLNSLYDFLGTGWWIGFFADSPGDEETFRKYAEAYGVEQNIRTFAIQRESDALYTMLVENNISAIYGDNLRLLALLRASDNPDEVRILEDWYGDVLPTSFAVPRNDADFRALVDHTLQDMAADHTYQRLWAEHFGLGDPLNIPVWPAHSPDEVED